MLKLREKILNSVKPFIALPLAGLDLSDTSVKFIKFGSSRSGLTFDFWGEFELALGLIEKGEIKDEAGLVKFLSSWFAKEGWRLRQVFFVASLPEEKSFLRMIQLPKIKQEDVANAVRWEIEANIPLPIEEAVFDYEIVKPSAGELDHLDVVVTAFPRSIIDSYLRVFRGVGIKIAFLELESQAAARALASSLDGKLPRILVDMGRNRTSIIFSAGGSIVFTDTVEFGGALLEENIAKALSVDKKEAMAIKKEQGLDPTAYGGKVFLALAPALEQLKAEIKRVADYYKAHDSHVHDVGRAVDKIVLTGGDANLDGLDTYLASGLSIETQRANPFVAVEGRLNMVVPPIPQKRALGFTTAVGLALRGI